MAGKYIVALELVTRLDIQVDADNEDDAENRALDYFETHFEEYTVDIKYGQWDTEVVQHPKEDA